MSTPSEVSLQPEAIIEFRDAAYRLANGQTLLNRISLTVRRGETLVLLGRSGAGKTTALKLINRLLDPTEGEVRVEDRRTTDWNPFDLRRHIGYVIRKRDCFLTIRSSKIFPWFRAWSSGRASALVLVPRNYYL